MASFSFAVFIALFIKKILSATALLVESDLGHKHTPVSWHKKIRWIRG
jgi:hypothetical protein